MIQQRKPIKNQLGYKKNKKRSYLIQKKNQIKGRRFLKRGYKKNWRDRIRAYNRLLTRRLPYTGLAKQNYLSPVDINTGQWMTKLDGVYWSHWVGSFNNMFIRKGQRHKVEAFFDKVYELLKIRFKNKIVLGYLLEMIFLNNRVWFDTAYNWKRGEKVTYPKLLPVLRGVQKAAHEFARSIYKVKLWVKHRKLKNKTKSRRGRSKKAAIEKSQKLVKKLIGRRVRSPIITLLIYREIFSFITIRQWRTPLHKWKKDFLEKMGEARIRLKLRLPRTIRRARWRYYNEKSFRRFLVSWTALRRRKRRLKGRVLRFARRESIYWPEQRVVEYRSKVIPSKKLRLTRAIPTTGENKKKRDLALALWNQFAGHRLVGSKSRTAFKTRRKIWRNWYHFIQLISPFWNIKYSQRIGKIYDTLLKKGWGSNVLDTKYRLSYRRLGVLGLITTASRERAKKLAQFFRMSQGRILNRKLGELIHAVTKRAKLRRKRLRIHKLRITQARRKKLRTARRSRR